MISLRQEAKADAIYSKSMIDNQSMKLQKSIEKQMKKHYRADNRTEQCRFISTIA